MTSICVQRLKGAALTMLCVAFFAAKAIQPAYADQFGFDEYPGVSIDIPEGFSLVNAERDGSGYFLRSTLVPVELAIRFYKQGAYTSAQAALENSIKKLNGTCSAKTVTWRNRNAAVAQSFSMNYNGKTVQGTGASCTLPEKLGTVVVFAWCTETNCEPYRPFLESCVDSLGIDRGSYYETGIITAAQFSGNAEILPITLTIGETRIGTALRENDRAAASALIEREYAVLSMYKKSPRWKQAWQRYYRMIFKDSFHRLNRAAFDIYNALSPSVKDDTELAQKLLTWTQGFSYEREKNSSDFTSLPGMLLGEGSDCDARGMLLSVLLQNMCVDAILFVSADYGHAIAGLVSDHPGQKIQVGTKEYLTGETTAQNVTWGMIAQSQQDFSKWIAIEPPLPFPPEPKP